MNNQKQKLKPKPVIVPHNQAQLLEQYWKEHKKRHPTSLKEILALRAEFEKKGMVI